MKNNSPIDPSEPENKLSNPKDMLGVRRAPTSFIPRPFIHGLGLAFLEGACRYGAANWRVAGVRLSVYMDALERHMSAFWEGEDIDPDSGLPHLVKAAACLAIMHDSYFTVQNAVDDRPPAIKAGWLKELNTKAESLMAAHPRPAAPFTQVRKLREGEGL